MVNVSTDYPAILQFNIIGQGSTWFVNDALYPGVSWKITYTNSVTCLERPFFSLLIMM